jgi:DNA-binding CsgD family transcriptional regulator
MRIVHANLAGETMLSSGTPMAACAGILTLRSPGAAAALTAAVAQAASNESMIGRKGLGIPVRRVGGETWVLHVLPLRHSELRANLMPGAVAAVFIAPTASHPVAANAAFAALYGLTAAEAGVLESVVAGRTNAETAQALGISLATVKTHLQHVFDKTDVRRQTDLVALVYSFRLPLES